MFQSLRSTLRLAPAPPTAAPRADLDAVMLFEQLVGETHLAALQAAAVASLVNALHFEQPLERPQTLIDLLPHPSAAGMIALARRCRADIGLPRATVRALEDFFADLDPARRLAHAFCADAAELGPAHATILHLAQLTATWHRLARHALKAVLALDADLARCLAARYRDNTPVLTALLASAAAGGQPCLDADGRPALPPLPQRRAAVRPNVCLPCVVEHQGKTSRAVVKDVSTGGLGLEHAGTLEANKVVLIEFADGRCCAGIVVWSKGSRAGIQLDTPLKPNDPLLAA